MSQSLETSPEMAAFRSVRDLVFLKLQWLSGERVDRLQRKAMAVVFGLMELISENEDTLSDQEMTNATALLQELVTHLNTFHLSNSRAASNKLVNQVQELLAPHLAI